MTDLLTKRREAAQERMLAAKSRFTLAAEAVLRGDGDAGTLARIALAAIEEARAELKRLDAPETR